MDFWTVIIAILSSSALTAIVNSLFLIYRDKKSKELAKTEDYYSKKEKCYIDAINWLLAIKRGFDYTREDLISIE